MKENYIKIAHLGIFYLIAAAIGLLPLLFVAQTANFFEFNKFILLLFVVVVGYVLWAITMILEKKFTFTKTPLDLPVLFFLIVSFIASLSSLDQFVSLVGAYGKPWPSFLASATVCAFYFLITSNIKTRKQIEQLFLILIGATTAAALVAIASYFGLYFAADYARFHSFNTLGSPTGLATLEAIVIPLAIYWVISTRDQIRFAISIACTLVMILSLILINFWPAYIGPLAAIIFSITSMLKAKFTREARNGLATILVVTLLVFLIRYVPQISQNTLGKWIKAKPQNVPTAFQIDTPKEVTLPQSAGWDIATSTIGKRPLFGTGPGTFAFAFTQLKPRYLNSTNVWLVTFDRSSSDFTEITTTMGIVGIIVYLILLAASLRFIYILVYKGQKPGPYLAVSSAIISAIAVSFFAVSSLVTAAIFFFAIAALGTIAKINDEKHVSELTVEVATLKNRLNWFPLGGNLGVIKTTDQGKNATKSQVLPIVFLIVILILAFFSLKYEVKAYQADYYYHQALLSSQRNDGNKTLDFLQKAVVTNPSVDAYHRALSQTALQIAITLNQKKDLSDSDKQILTSLISVAVDQAKVASGYQILPLRVPGISAANVANWIALADAYQTIIGSVGQSEVHAANALSQAVNLDPANVILHDRLGLLYQRINNLDLAQRKFEDATIIKPDYGPAHYHLAKILIAKKGDIVRIAQELTLTKQLLPPDDPAMADIDSNLKDYNKQIQDAQKQQATQQAAIPSAQPSPSPSPSPQATSSAVPNISPIPTSKPSL